jgi:hypothetical protein
MHSESNDTEHIIRNPDIMPWLSKNRDFTQNPAAGHFECKPCSRQP